SSSVRIDFGGAASAGGVCGTVVFGEGEPLPLPTDAAALPPGGSLDLVQVGHGLREGFAYQFVVPGPYPELDSGIASPDLESSIVGRRVRFTVNLLQFFNAWCNLQPAYQFVPDAEYQSELLRREFYGYGCLPPGFIGPPGEGASCPEFPGVSLRKVSCA